MLVIAHRGANREALENSWSAFAKAIECGSARIELDTQLSKDGQMVIMHDADLMRTCGHPARVSDLTRAELEKIKLLNGEAIPFLDEVITKLLPEIELNIELKGNTPQDAAEVARLLQNNPLHSKAIVSSFYSTPLEYLAQSHPELSLACLWGDVFVWPNFSHYSPLIFMQRVGASIIHPWTDYVTAEFMDQARNRGWKVFPYASFRGEDDDREGMWAHLQTLGVDGLCTNYPRELKAWLNKVNEDAARFSA